jgi:hypothetical protein
MGDVIGLRDPVARKDHSCWWCAEAIKKGEKYSAWTWADGGSVLSIKAHLECVTAWNTCYDSDSVEFGAYSRGCTCEHGRCDCKKEPRPEGGKEG